MHCLNCHVDFSALLKKNGNEVPKFCFNCGQETQKTCLHCQTVLQGNAKFCSGCGKSTNEHEAQQPKDDLPLPNKIGTATTNDQLVTKRATPAIEEAKSFIKDCYLNFFPEIIIRSAPFMPTLCHLVIDIGDAFEPVKSEEELEDECDEELFELNEQIAAEAYGYSLGLFAGHDFNSIMYEMEASANLATGKSVVDTVNKLNSIFATTSAPTAIQFEHLKLKEDNARKIGEEISAILKRLSGSEIRRLADCHAKIYARKHFILDEEGSGLANKMQYLAAGAAAVAMPVIGIPALAAKWFHSEETNKKAEREREIVGEEFDKAISIVDEIPFSEMESCLIEMLRAKMENLYGITQEILLSNGADLGEDWISIADKIEGLVSDSLVLHKEEAHKFFPEDQEKAESFLNSDKSAISERAFSERLRYLVNIS